MGNSYEEGKKNKLSDGAIAIHIDWIHSRVSINCNDFVLKKSIDARDSLSIWNMLNYLRQILWLESSSV